MQWASMEITEVGIIGKLEDNESIIQAIIDL